MSHAHRVLELRASGTGRHAPLRPATVGRVEEHGVCDAAVDLADLPAPDCNVVQAIAGEIADGVNTCIQVIIGRAVHVCAVNQQVCSGAGPGAQCPAGVPGVVAERGQAGLALTLYTVLVGEDDLGRGALVQPGGRAC